MCTANKIDKLDSNIRIERVWSMPNKNTFDIPPIKTLLREEVNLEQYWIDPFANRNKIASVTNDLNPEYDTDYHLDALDFLKSFGDETVDGVLYDPPYCYDCNTDIFTRDGWKAISEVTTSDEVATLNVSTNMFEWEHPTNIIHQHYEGKMVSIESQNVSLMVTPNHRCLVKNCFYGDYHWTNAKDLFTTTTRHWFKKSCSWYAPVQEYFILPAVNFVKNNRYGEKCKPAKKFPMDLWLKFLGLYLTEGSYSEVPRRKGKRYDYRIRISQKKPDVRHELEQIISSLGYRYTASSIDYSIFDKQLWTYLKNFGRSYDKYIPTEIKELAPSQLQILIDYLIMGDGSDAVYSKLNKMVQKVYPYRTKVFRTSSIRLRDDFCEIAIKCGYAISIYKPKEHEEGYAPLWTVHLLGAKDFKVNEKSCNKDVDFSGMIYCVSVPNTTLLVKRNGRIFWCGNSPRQVSECYHNIGYDVTQETTRASFWANHKREISRIVRVGGKVITFGWNSGGIGRKYGFNIERILLVPHGGWHNDTICTVEVKAQHGKAL